MLLRGLLTLVVSCLLTVPAVGGSELLFREDWKELPPSLPVDQSHVSNPDLLLSLYGPGMHGVKKSHHDWIENDPYYVWSGACPGNWAVGLRHRSRSFDLSKEAKVVWRSKQSGFRQLRLILKLADGSWMVSDAFDSESPDWRVFEIKLSQVRWRDLDISRVSERDWVDSPDLTKVVEVGFTDLMPGGMSAACSRLDWIEVHGQW